MPVLHACRLAALRSHWQDSCMTIGRHRQVTTEAQRAYHHPGTCAEAQVFNLTWL